MVKTSQKVLSFSISENFFSEEFLNLFNMILNYFPSGGCVDEALSNRTNSQGYKYL